MKNVNPDVIAWQEIREMESDTHTNQIEQLAAIIPGYQWMYHSAMLFSNGVEEEGLGIFVRKDIDIVHQKVVRLPRKSDCNDDNTRIMFLLELNMDGRTFYFVNSHWSYESHCQLV